MISFLLVYSLFTLLGLGLACAIDDDINMLGWDDAKPCLRGLLPLLYVLISCYGVLLLLKKTLPQREPDWWIYVRVMWLGGNYKLNSNETASFIFQIYNRRGPTKRGKRWKRQLAARIIRLNRPHWHKYHA